VTNPAAFTRLPRIVEVKIGPDAAALAIATRLYQMAGKRAQTRYKQETMAESLGLSLRTVERRIRRLKACGVIEVRRTPSAAYTWLLDHPAYAEDLAVFRASQGRYSRPSSAVYGEGRSRARSVGRREFTPEDRPRMQPSQPADPPYATVNSTPPTPYATVFGGCMSKEAPTEDEPLQGSSSSGGHPTPTPPAALPPTRGRGAAGGTTPRPTGRGVVQSRRATGRRTPPPDDDLLDPQRNGWEFRGEWWVEVYSLDKAQRRNKHRKAEHIVAEQRANRSSAAPTGAASAPTPGDS
jgi:biotin operon repressor